jgi:hypothetical protein
LIWSGKSKDEIATEAKRFSRRYVTDDSFYEAIGPWINIEKVREMRRRADREEAEHRRGGGKSESKEKK